MPNKPAVYWDSCVFIDRLQRSPTRITLLESLTDGATAGDFLIVTSVVAITEVLKLPSPGATPAEEMKRIAEFFENPWISVRIVDQEVAELAARLRRSHGLKTRDAIHIATALHYSIPVFHTYDMDLLKKDGQISHDKRTGASPLRIIEPSNLTPAPPI